jgi:hypothetical protein
MTAVRCRRGCRRVCLVARAGVAVWLVGLTACGSARQELPAREEPAVVEDLPAPSWRIVARREGKVLLAAQRVILRGIRRRVDPGRSVGSEPGSEYPTLIFENGRLRAGPVARVSVLVVPGGRRRDTLRLYSLEFEGRPVLFAQAGEGPHPHESPAEPGLYIVEQDDHLWLLTPTAVTKFTADSVRGIARDTLWEQQREGVRYLFWATSPLWSPDGSAVAYVTNRTWMLTRPSGQEVWLVDLRTRRERPLLSEQGEFFSPQGWLGSELVYSGRERPISGIGVRTGARRAIATGAVVTVSASPPRLLYMTSRGDALFRAHVLTERGVVVDVPDPPAGEHLSFGGTFSPSGNRLVLGTWFQRDSGVTRALYTFDLGTKRLTRLMQWSARESRRYPDGAPPAWLDDSTLLLNQLDRSTGLESSTLLRLRGAATSRNGAGSR